MDTLCSYWIPRLFTTTEQDPTQTHSAVTSTQNSADTTVLSSYPTISSDYSSICLTRSSSSEGNNFPGYGIDQHEFRTQSSRDNPPDQQDFGNSYFDDFDSGYYYDAEKLSALGACNALTSEFPVDEAAEGFWDVDADYDIWQLTNSDNLGF
ncbi:hypothetical protein MLD38_003911 [Melastoma candidum]|nr:hypothetical protein MLD38_003911 [Melastoma candidum]